jgi:hypothetical protein
LYRDHVLAMAPPQKDLHENPKALIAYRSA